MASSNDGNEKLTEEDHMRLKYHLVLAGQNWFKFEVDLKESERIFEKNPKSMHEKKLLGCMALNILLEGDVGSEKFEQAIKYEKHLFKTTSQTAKYSLSRRRTYELEIGIMKDPVEGNNIITPLATREPQLPQLHQLPNSPTSATPPISPNSPAAPPF